MRKNLALFLVTLSALALATSASADPPAGSPPPVVVGHFEFTNDFPGDSTLCGFPVDWTFTSSGSFRYFPGEQGHGLTNATTGRVDYRFSANGKTVAARVRLAETFFPDKDLPELPVVLTMHGLSIQIRLLGGGIVIQDAGLVVELPDATAVVVRGPHPVLEAGGETAAVETICGQLSP